MHSDPTEKPAPHAAQAAEGEPRAKVEPARVREKLVELVEPVLAAHKCELVELDWRREPIGWVLRLYVERLGHDPRNTIGGVGIDECAWISRDVSTALDVADLVDHHYNLEVSSPGLERPLAKAEHYRRFAGLRAKVRLEQALDAHPGRKAFKGEILGERDGKALLRDDDVGEVALPIGQIQRASLVYEPAPKVKPGKQSKQKAKGAAPNAAATREEHADKPRKLRGDSEHER